MNEVEDLLDDLARMQVFYINIGGGEPLLHPRLLDILDSATSRGIFVQFSTNGTLIDQKMAAEVANRSVRVQVSMDGWRALENDVVRGTGSFKMAMKAVELLSERAVDLSINCVVTKFVIEGLVEMLELAKSFGARLRLSRLRPSGRALGKWQSMVPTRNQYVKLYHWLLRHPEVKTGDSFFFLSSLGQPLPGLNFCGAGKLTCSVDPEGIVYPCPFISDATLVAGSIRETPLSRIWAEGKLFDMVPGKEAAACLHCESFNNCRGGCRGASYLLHGNWHMPDPECLRGKSDETVPG